MLTHTLYQVAKDYQLLDTARDYFQFVTNFFEVINVSATHIYHSALELSPLLSTIRKFYYSQQPHPSPRVILGLPDLWDEVMASVSTLNSLYQSSIWSPCSHFVAAVTNETVEIRGALALNPLFTLQSAGVVTKFLDSLAYSPDGHSLACSSDNAIIIWDTQTGGVVRKIDCEVDGNGSEFVWSLDGNMIGIVSPLIYGSLTVCVYEVTSGTMWSSSTVESMRGRCLWAHNKSFQIMTMTGDCRGSTISIYEVGLTLTKVEQFHIWSHTNFGAFSPATYRISTSILQHRSQDLQNHDQVGLLIFNICNSEVLLRESGFHQHVNFSPDGNLIAAFTGGRVLIWRYTSSCYTRWRQFQQAPDFLQFSPTSSSILICTGALLCVLHLSTTALAIESDAITHGAPLDVYIPNRPYIVTAHCMDSVIKIINLCSQDPPPSQFIDTGLEISAMVLTGNVLLVKGSGTVVAWLLTEEGMASGILGKRRVGRRDSLWDVPSQIHDSGLLGQGEAWNGDSGSKDLWFSVRDSIAAVGWQMEHIHRYDTETGEILDLDGTHVDTRYYFGYSHPHNCDHYHRGLYKHHNLFRLGWPVSQTTLIEGWVKDSGGKYWLWLHPRWRLPMSDVDWLDWATTLRLKSSSGIVIIKF